MSLLEVSGLAVNHGAVSALRGVDFRVEDGEIVAVIGANGAGKSTLLKTMAGLITPRAGTIIFDGESIAGRPAYEVVRRGVTLLPEGRELFREMTVLDNLHLGFLPARRSGASLSERLDYAFSLFPRLAERRSQHASTLSGGEAQMLGVARSLMCSPRLLVVDELSLGLAPQIVEQLFDVLTTINRNGTSVLIVEQFVHLALQHSHRAYVLEKGEVALTGASSEVAANDAVVNAYLGVNSNGASAA
jgi:branched-chain amino acid transport system ATP-binding protein